MVINPIVGVYIPIIRIPIKGRMTIPNIATFDHGTYSGPCLIYSIVFVFNPFWQPPFMQNLDSDVSALGSLGDSNIERAGTNFGPTQSYLILKKQTVSQPFVCFIS